MKTDIEKQMDVERIFHHTWQMYMGAMELGLLPNPFKLLPQGIKKPQIVCICKGVNYAGRYFTRGNLVQINTAYYDGVNDKNLKQTIAHEIAHHLQWVLVPGFKQWHGPEFRQIMEAIGFEANTYHDMSPRIAASRAAKSKDELFDLG